MAADTAGGIRSAYKSFLEQCECDLWCRASFERSVIQSKRITALCIHDTHRCCSVCVVCCHSLVCTLSHAAVCTQVGVSQQSDIKRPGTNLEQNAPLSAIRVTQQLRKFLPSHKIQDRNFQELLQKHLAVASHGGLSLSEEVSELSAECSNHERCVGSLLMSTLCGHLNNCTR